MSGSMPSMRCAVEDDFAADDFAVLGLEQARDRLQRRRLAGAVGAEQRHDRALRHLEAEAAQHQDDLVVDHLDVADAEQRGGGCAAAVAGRLITVASVMSILVVTALCVITRESG